MPEKITALQALTAFAEWMEENRVYGTFRVQDPEGRVIGKVRRRVRGGRVFLTPYKRPRRFPGLSDKPFRFGDAVPPTVELKDPESLRGIDLAEIERELDEEDRAN